MKKKFWVKKIIGFIVFAFAATALLSFVVMSLWNNILAVVLHVSLINFWQALGILVLSKILFGGFRFGGSHNSHRWKNKFANMTPEEKDAFKEKMKDRWGKREC